MATARVTEILRGCYSHVEVAGRDGSRGAGLDVRGASCLLVSPPTTGWREWRGAVGIGYLNALAEATQL